MADDEHPGDDQGGEAARQCGQRKALAVMLDTNRALGRAGRCNFRRRLVRGLGLVRHFFGLVATGAYLTAHSWTWSTAWIDASIAGLIVVSLQGALVGGPRTEALKDAIQASGPGTLDAEARHLAHDRALWIVLLANPGVVLGIVWNMTVKPGAAGAIAAIVVGYAVGAAAALAAARTTPG